MSDPLTLEQLTLVELHHYARQIGAPIELDRGPQIRAIRLHRTNMTTTDSLYNFDGLDPVD